MVDEFCLSSTGLSCSDSFLPRDSYCDSSLVTLNRDTPFVFVCHDLGIILIFIVRGRSLELRHAKTNYFE